MRNPYRKLVGIDRKIFEIAMRQASKTVENTEFSVSGVDLAKQKEGVRIKVLANYINSQVLASIRSFPVIDDEGQIYEELVDCLIGLDNLDAVLTRLNKTTKLIQKMQMNALKKLKYKRDSVEARTVRKEFYGRVNGFMKRNLKNVDFVNDAVRELRSLPDFDEYKRVIIAGLPNVGKSSLLGQLTGSKPKVQPYPFTTKGLMIGYIKALRDIQVIDTPGLLDRPILRRNKIEIQGIIALRHLADLVVYIFDISETCGYTLEQQKKLLKEIKKLIKKPVILVANKTDVVGGREVSELKMEDVYPVSCDTGEGIDELRELIKKSVKKTKL